jgi:hypothetical protein
MFFPVWHYVLVRLFSLVPTRLPKVEESVPRVRFDFYFYLLLFNLYFKFKFKFDLIFILVQTHVQYT